MLYLEPTKHHAGVVLWGDPWALRALYEFIHRVNTESSLIVDKEGFMLGLAYDVRKAFQGARSKRYRNDSEDKCPFYGVEILWPVLIAEVGLMRQSMAFVPTTRLDQAIMYELEAIIESAISSVIPGQQKGVMEQMQQMSAIPGHVEKVLGSRCRYFIDLPAGQRLKMLPRLLQTFNPLYVEMARSRWMRESEKLIPPEVFEQFVDAGEDWPEFDW